MSCNDSHPSFRRLTQHRSIPGILETLAPVALIAYWKSRPSRTLAVAGVEMDPVRKPVGRYVGLVLASGLFDPLEGLRISGRQP